ncbi:hypothetical protein NLI96_g12662 [Meripilus lineatus]|uniref:Uncharacterized protein n=1 Tax=Meripilus lineatus TaxID=2056292 RepID=A0AAD5UTF3_9APHY|nr:hypothetical protein NLI96_g12662 [Physisporinus lineatus]
MDSDDEEILEQLELQLIVEWVPVLSDVLDWSQGDIVYLKLHQAEEWERLRYEYDCWRETSVSEIDWSRDVSAWFRFKRFCKSIQGFHKGNLDLTGRHEHRYRRLYARWNRFLADVLNLSLHATEVEVSVEECGKMVMEIDHTFDRPEVLEKFRRDWKTGSVSLETVFHHTKKTLKYLSMYPTPIFQKLLLLDLPPELVHYVMFVATSGDARRLGSTSKYFRKISLSYIYTSRTFDIPFKPGPLVPRTPEDIDEEQKKIRVAGDTLLEELDFVLSRPHILESLQDVTMFGQRYGLVKKILGFESGSREYRNFFGPFESRIGPILSRTPNLKTLAFSQLLISNALELSHNLHSIWVYSAQMNTRRTTKPPRYPSVINAYLVFASDEARSLWSLLESFPNLRSLHTRLSSELAGIGPEADIRTRFNPFTTLERLAIERADPDHIEALTEWIQESPSLELTHFWLEGGGPGLFPRQTRELLLALDPAPLQVLVLDGIHHVEPSLLDEIATIFPDLRALSLLYRQSERQTQSGVSTWPHTSWEYAPHFHDSLLRGGLPGGAEEIGPRGAPVRLEFYCSGIGGVLSDAGICVFSSRSRVQD